MLLQMLQEGCEEVEELVKRRSTLGIKDWSSGLTIGVDEAGYGCIAGPFTAAAVVTTGEKIPGLRDSKALSDAKRTALTDQILASPDHDVAFVELWPEEVDALGPAEAHQAVMQRAVAQLRPDYPDASIIIDGNNAFGVRDARTIVRADALIYEVKAASIIAKTLRDLLLEYLVDGITGYAFGNHKGYGTVRHLEEVHKCGAIKGIHRRSFLKKREGVIWRSLEKRRPRTRRLPRSW